MNSNWLESPEEVVEALLLEDLQEIEQNSWIINLSLVDGVMVQDAVGVVKPAQMFILHSALSPDRKSFIHKPTET